MTPSSVVNRRSLLAWSTLAALAGVHCRLDSSSVVDAGSSPPDSGAPADYGGSDGGAPSDAGASGDDAGSGCSPACSGATAVCDDHGTCKTCTTTAGCSADAPVCDTSANGGSGQCKKVEVVAFYTPDP